MVVLPFDGGTSHPSRPGKASITMISLVCVMRCVFGLVVCVSVWLQWKNTLRTCNGQWWASLIEGQLPGKEKRKNNIPSTSPSVLFTELIRLPFTDAYLFSFSLLTSLSLFFVGKAVFRLISVLVSRIVHSDKQCCNGMQHMDSF